jgi:hypothetical protein
MGVIRNLQKNSKLKQSVARFHIVLLMMFVGTFSFAQTIITGKVTDATTGEGLISANVYLKSNLSKGTITDFDGNYTITVPKGAKVLVFSYIGYGLKKVSINKRTAIDVMMSESIDIAEVVVTGLSISRDKKSLGMRYKKLMEKQFRRSKRLTFLML